MNKQDVRIIKKKILKCLTEDIKTKKGKLVSKGIFDKKEGFAVYNNTDLQMVMDKVVLGIMFAYDELGGNDGI